VLGLCQPVLLKTGIIPVSQNKHIAGCEFTIVQSAVLRLHTVRPSVRLSVCPSVTLVDQDHIRWKSSSPKTSIAIISRTGKATDFKICPVHSQGPSEQKPVKNFREKSVGVSRECQRVFVYHIGPVVSGTGTAMNFKFCSHIHRIDWNKSPLRIPGKVAVGVLRDSRKFSGHPYIGRIARSSLR